MRKYFSISMTVFFCCYINAQVNDTSSKRRSEMGQIRFARFQENTKSNRKMQNDVSFLKSALIEIHLFMQNMKFFMYICSFLRITCLFILNFKN
jgi:hypothetical protein